MCDFSVLNPELWNLRVLKRKRFFRQDLNWCESFYCHHPIISAAEIFIFYYRRYLDSAGVVMYWWCLLFSASKISETLNFKTYLSCKDYSLQLSTAPMIYSFWVNDCRLHFSLGNHERQPPKTFIFFSFSGRMTFWSSLSIAHFPCLHCPSTQGAQSPCACPDTQIPWRL